MAKEDRKKSHQKRASPEEAESAASARKRSRSNGAADAGARFRSRGIRVVEFSHMVMGPTCGMILGDLGAEVIKVEPPGGDKTRRLIGSGAGFFPLFNRNKKSVTADLPTRRIAPASRS